MKVPVANRRANDHPIVVMPFDDIGTVQVQGVRIDAQLFKLRGEKRSDFTGLPVAGGELKFSRALLLFAPESGGKEHQ